MGKNKFEISEYSLPLNIEQMEDGSYMATSPKLSGLVVLADSVEEANQLAPSVAKELIAARISLIRDEDEYDQSIVLLNELIDIVRSNENHIYAELMDMLGTHIYEYENIHYPMPEIDHQRRIGGAKNAIKPIAEDFNAPLTDFEEYMH